MLKLGKKVLQTTFPLAWFALILLLPVTSNPFVARLVGSEMVAAPAALPLLWLLLVWWLPTMLRGASMPRSSVPLLGFITAALIASLAAFFYLTPPFRDRSIFSREAQALLTLGVGAAFYLVSASWAGSKSRLLSSLQAINFSGLIILVWSLVQAYFWFIREGYPEALNTIQQTVSLHELYPTRVTGFAFEPSWLAHQLNMLYLPFWLAATLQRFSAHRFRLVWLSFENFLLIGGVFVLLLSFSRVGLLAFLLVIGFVILQVNLHLARRLHHWLSSHLQVGARWRSAVGSLLSLGLLLSFLLVYLAGTYGLLRVGARYDVRLARLFEKQDVSIFSFEFTNQLIFAERVVFWATGWEIFNDHPVLGVGLGNAGFYFQDKLPNFSYALVEVNTLMYHNSYLPNTKNLWVRLLAETGLVGFSFFLAWLYVIWKVGVTLFTRDQPLLRTIGMAGVLVLVALVVEGFSVDSFALPYLWISLGLVSASGMQIQPLPVE